MPAIFLLGKTEVFICESMSLKYKRHTLRSLKDKIKAKTTASIAETNFNDLWQRAELAFSITGSNKDVLQKQLEIIEKILTDNTDIQVVYFYYNYIEGDF